MQVFVIHGGTSFATYEDYLDFLKSTEIKLEKLNARGWKNTIEEELGGGFQVIRPRMPNAENSKYNEWKIWFERFFPFIEDNIILIGHSRGGAFLAKYLSENDFPKKIKAVFLVAAPFDSKGSEKWMKNIVGEFSPPDSLKKFQDQASRITIYHSEDDPIVELSESMKYQRALPNAIVRIFQDRGHFNQETFPELVTDIKSLNG